MRRPFDLNQPGVILMKLSGLFALLIPAILYCVSLFMNDSDTMDAFLHKAIRVSFAAGILIFVVLLILIIVEQIQDHNFDVWYRKNQGQKLPLADGNYECQYCGNRSLKANEKICRVCNKELRQ